jgi:hypothetical protein
MPLVTRAAIRLALFALFLLVAVQFANGPTSADVRLDTGDLRYCWYGIPFRWSRMPEPDRSKLVALAALPPAIPARWVNCANSPFALSHGSQIMTQRSFARATYWLDEDPQLARWAMEEAVAPFDATFTSRGNDAIYVLLQDPQIITPTSVTPAWRSDTDLQEFCRRYGHIPAPK